MRVSLCSVCLLLASEGFASSRYDVAREKIRGLRYQIDQRLDHIHGSERKMRNPAAYRANEDDACDAVEGENVFVTDLMTFWSPSFWEACAATLAVDADNMLLHIASVDQLFRQYHCFYDLAKDPENSESANHQAEFGNTIFGFNGGGAVDVEAEFERIAEKVEQQGYASLETFWEMGTVFAALRDGHVAPPQVTFADYYYLLIPNSYLDQVLSIVPTASYSMDDNRDIRLTLEYSVVDDFGNTSTLDTMEVDTINGLSVREWLVYAACHPSVYGPYPTVGARINNIMKSGQFFDFGLKQLVSSTTLPWGIMPDIFSVVLTGGEIVVFRTVMLPVLIGTLPLIVNEAVAGKSVAGLNRTLIEDLINQPGDQFDAYIRSIGELPDDFGEPTLRRQRDAVTISLKNTNMRKLQENVSDPLLLHQYGQLNDDVLFYKFTLFNLSPNQTIGVWNDLVAAALEGGQNKLLIDLSDNPGGFILHAYSLLWAMFPEVGVEWLSNQFDSTFNDAMTQYMEVAVPFLRLIDEEIALLSKEELQARIDSLTDDDFSNYYLAVVGIADLCSPLFSNCTLLDQLSESFSNFYNSSDVISYIAFIDGLAKIVYNFNPWETVLGDQDLAARLYKAGPVTTLRGGVLSNTTVRYSLGEPLVESLGYDNWTQFQGAVIAATQGLNPFDEIVFLSNGLASSSSAILSYTASQLYRNRYRTGATTKVRLISYGGTGKPNDLAFAAIPAGLEYINLENPIIGDVALQLLIDILPKTMVSLDEIVAQSIEYSNSIAIPPYFANLQPAAPGHSFYDSSMEPRALALQFVKIPLDGYIPKIVMTDDELVDIYRFAIGFFDVA